MLYEMKRECRLLAIGQAVVECAARSSGGCWAAARTFAHVICCAWREFVLFAHYYKVLVQITCARRTRAHLRMRCCFHAARHSHHRRV